MKTQVGIIGAGPAGLMLAHLLHVQGIECVVLESCSRVYVEARVRAGVLEQGSVELIDSLGLGTRLHQEALIHHGVELGFDRRRHHFDFDDLVGKTVTVYGQQEVIKDLIKAAESAAIPVLFDVSEVSLHGIEGGSPKIVYTSNGAQHDLHCDFIAGCDGFHGVSRPSVPAGVLTTYDVTYPFSWLGILADAAPSQREIVYMNSERGFSLFSMRSPTVTRLYIQCDNDTNIADWSDDRIWDELLLRLKCDDGWQPNVGPILQKSVAGLRSFVAEPMQYGRLFLAGDAVHIVPPTGAKGMNLALSDVKVLAEGFVAFYRNNTHAALDRYSSICLRRVWKTQRFSWWMTSMMHHFPGSPAFDYRRQIAEIDYLSSSRAAATTLAENYVGLPIESAL